MSDLLSMLQLGANGLAAQNNGVAVASNNAANANTVGYSRQTIDYNSALNGGVTTGNPTRYASALLSGQVRAAAGNLANSTASQSAISDLEDTLTSGTSVDTRMATLFSQISQASAQPTDAPSRDAVVQATRDLVTTINGQAAQIADARHTADQRVGDNVPQASQLAQQLADANKLVGQTNDPAAADHRDQIASQLSALVGGSARVDSDGNMRFVLDGGAVLVDGTHAAQIQTTTDPSTGYNQVQVVDGNVKRDVTSQVGGTIGADLTFRDTTAKAAADKLDQVAYDTATAFNGVHTANAALDGTTGHAMFVAPTAVSGAAAQLKIDPTLDADSTKLALAGPGTAVGDNTGGVALFALSAANVANGGTQTLTDSALSMLSNLGIAGAGAKSDAARDQVVSDHLAGLSDSLSGVDTQEELTNLARFQNASAAMTKFVSSIDTMLTNIIQNL
jgi:flagellar hook-associated protein 1 FlgK